MLEISEDGGADGGAGSLLLALRCPECRKALADAECGPTHALLVDSPVQHPWLLPEFEKAVARVRDREEVQCPRCGVPVATRGCVHVVERWGQVWLSSDQWEKTREEIRQVREEVREFDARLKAYIDFHHGELDRVEADRAEWAWRRVVAAEANIRMGREASARLREELGLVDREEE